MAFYSSDSCSYYDYDYGYNYDYKDDYNAHHQPSYTYPEYEIQDENFYNSTTYYSSQYQYNPTNISYSTSFYSDPNTYNHDFVQTEYTVSYSVAQSDQKVKDDVDDFDEYDPTPYGGGYDLVLTYGKPLLPSDEICYPRSHHNHQQQQQQDRVDDPSTEVSGFQGVQALDEIPFVDEKVEDRPQLEYVDTEKVAEQETKQEGLIEHTPIWSHTEPENKENGDDYRYGDENQVVEREPEIHTGHDSNAKDLSESLFGYWNGLSLQKGEEVINNGSEGGYMYNADMYRMSQWDEGPADYLFGHSDSHGDLRIEAGIYESPIFGYEKHFQEPLQYGQVEYDPYFYHSCRVSEHEF